MATLYVGHRWRRSCTVIWKSVWVVTYALAALSSSLKSSTRYTRSWQVTNWCHVPARRRVVVVVPACQHVVVTRVCLVLTSSQCSQHWHVVCMVTVFVDRFIHICVDSLSHCQLHNLDVTHGLFRRQLKRHLFREAWTQCSVTSDM